MIIGSDTRVKVRVRVSDTISDIPWDVLFFFQVGIEVAPHLKDSLDRNFFDLLSTFRQISGESVRSQLVVQRVEIPEYLTLYSPAISWILQCIAHRAPEVQEDTGLTVRTAAANGTVLYIFVLHLNYSIC